MEYFVNRNMMQQIDSLSISSYGIPSLVLMERAALGVAEAVMSLPEEKRKLVVCVCGCGNNGADGIAVARILKIKGCRVLVLCVGNEAHATEEWRLQRDIAKKLHIEIGSFLEHEAFSSQKLYGIEDVALSRICFVDAIFGIGLNRQVSGDYERAICQLSRLHEAGASMVSVDIPSGLLADSGNPAGCSVEADLTVTFGYKKVGQVLSPGFRYCGRLIVNECGFAPEAFYKTGYSAFGYEREELCELLPKRDATGHKGTFGRVLVIAGNEDMSGAACFSALACMRCGCGLVKVLTVKENREVIHNYIPEAILSVYDKEHPDYEKLGEELKWADAVVFGPGMGQDKHVHAMLGHILDTFQAERYRKPLVIDADGLRVLGASEEFLGKLNAMTVLTPHIGELSALTGKTSKELMENLPVHTKLLAEQTHAIVVAKCARTLVAAPCDEAYYINSSGSDALATAGSGDVLTGIMAAFLAVGMDPAKAARLSVFVHGLAGEEAKRKVGSASFVIARDIIAGLSGVFSGY